MATPDEVQGVIDDLKQRYVLGEPAERAIASFVGAKHVQPAYRKRQRTDMAILHDSRSGPGATVEWLRWEGRRQGLLDIGYHYLIYPDGAVIQSRHPRLMGSHAPGFNHRALGLCMIGGRDDKGEPSSNFTQIQKVATFTLYVDLVSQFGALELRGITELMRLLGREAAGTPSPFLDMDLLRDELNTWIQQEMRSKRWVTTT